MVTQHILVTKEDLISPGTVVEVNDQDHDDNYYDTVHVATKVSKT